MTAKIRVLIVDDHPMVRKGTREMLEPSLDIEVIGESIDGFEAVAHARDMEPDVILMDVGMAGLNGIEAMKAILRDRPSTRVVMLSVHTDHQYVTEAIRNGAAGYLLKSIEETALAEAVTAAARGGSVLDPSLGATIPEMIRRGGVERQLSPRQVEVLALVADGHSNRVVGERLGMSARTVEVHLRKVFDRLGVSSRTEAVVEALHLGLLELDQ